MFRDRFKLQRRHKHCKERIETVKFDFKKLYCLAKLKKNVIGIRPVVVRNSCTNSPKHTVCVKYIRL